MDHPLLLAAAILALAAAAPAGQKFTERWNYLRADLGSDKGMEAFLALMKQSKDVGCTHILLVDGRWLRSPEDTAYMARVEKVQAIAREGHLTVIPCLYALGYSGRYLGFDPNLFAGLPVREMPFVVQGKTAVADPALNVDTSGLTADGRGVTGTIKVKPFTHYRVSFAARSEFSGDPEEWVRFAGKVGHRWVTRRTLDSRKVTLQPNEAGEEPHAQKGENVGSAGFSPFPRDRIRPEGRTPNAPLHSAEVLRILYETTFNSLEADELSVRIGQAVEGLRIEPAGLLMVIRRGLCPLKVARADGQAVYEEGKDFQPVSDPKLTTDGEFVFTHEPPAIRLTADSRIRDGERLCVSFFHAYRLGSDQDVISMEDPKVLEIMERDAANCARIWKADGYFMNYDEIRIGGWERPDRKPGEVLAEHVQKGYGLIRKYAPQATIYTWSDMFNPHHNARDFKANGYYYLVNGNWDGSWKGLPKDVIIMNWYSPKPEGMTFFSDLGHRQVMCGYYDGASTEQMKSNVAGWMRASEGVPNVLGFMYTTWRNNYGNMKEYFGLVETYGR